MKFIFKEGKEYYANFGGHLVEVKLDNIEADIEIMRRVLSPIEEVHDKYEKEIMRLNRIKAVILKNKYCSNDDKGGVSV